MVWHCLFLRWQFLSFFSEEKKERKCKVTVTMWRRGAEEFCPFFISQEIASCEIKSLRQDAQLAEKKYAAYAACSRAKQELCRQSSGSRGVQSTLLFLNQVNPRSQCGRKVGKYWIYKDFKRKIWWICIIIKQSEFRGISEWHAGIRQRGVWMDARIADETENERTVEKASFRKGEKLCRKN